MKPAGMLRQVAILFAFTGAAYALAYGCLQHQRSKNGPWRVTFAATNGQPVLVINQPALQIRDVRIVLGSGQVGTNLEQELSLGEVRPVPFDVPFGRCIFQDAQTLPGTLAFELFGHEIQLLPRVLTIDKVERPWRSGETIVPGQPAGEPPRGPR